jgi:hypothetical protein
VQGRAQQGGRTYLSYANVVSTLALFLVLTGGVVFAATKLKPNSVGSKQIKDGAVLSIDVGDDSLTGQDIDEATLDSAILQRRIGSNCSPGQAIRAIAADGTVTCEADDAGGPPSGAAGGDLSGTYPNPEIAGNAVGGPEVAGDALTGADVLESSLFNDNSLNGADVDESTLSGVNAATVGGSATCRTATPVTMAAFAAQPTICTVGPFTIKSDCTTNGMASTIVGSSIVIVNASANNSFVASSTGFADADFDGGETVSFQSGFDGSAAGPTASTGTFHLAAPSGPQLAASWAVSAETPSAFAGNCTLSLVGFS